jgi:acyl-CoA dehydrogenase
VLNGTKCFISNGGEADIYVVLARTDPEKGPMGISGLIVEKGTPGFSFGRKEEKLGLRGDVSRELFFEDCQVPRSNLLSEGILPSVTREVATLGMPGLGAIAVGLGQTALEAATQYVKERPVAFGQTLANFDGIQCAIADMATMVEASRLLVLRAGAISEDAADLTPGVMAGLFACETALDVTSKALQAFGTSGYTADFPIERYFRDARGLMLVAWPMEVRRLILGRLKLGLPTLAPLGPPPPKPGGA